MTTQAAKAKSRKTVYVAGLAEQVDATYLHATFLTFGNITDVQIPPHPEKKAPHRGFGFVEFETAEEAADAIDNMHLNVLAGRVIKCNIAKPLKATQVVGQGNRAVWANEDWLKTYGTGEAKRGIELDEVEGEGGEDMDED